MIKKLIKKIRHQPKAARDKVALVIAGVFTVCVSLVWVYHLPERMSAFTEGQDDDSSPGFSQLLSEIGDTFSSLKESIPEEIDLDALEAELGAEGQSGSSSVSATEVSTSSSTPVTSSSTLPILSTDSSSLSGTNSTSSASSTRTIRIVTSSSSSPTTSSTTDAEVE